MSDGNHGSREFTENFLVAVFLCRPVIELVVVLPLKMSGQLGIFTVSWVSKQISTSLSALTLI